MQTGNVIDVNNISIQFRLYKEQVNGLKDYCIKKIQHKLQYDDFWALKDVSFKVKKGEAVALVGKNGSGKSTMLKLVAGVMRPTLGTISTSGNMAPMIELGAGFDFDLTAKENIFLNGAILGYSREMLKDNMENILEFAELMDFCDVPIKNYSSGMVTRLGFSIATICKPDILIVDEILAVGDFRFQQKCEQRIQKMLSDGTTLLLVSHNTEQVKRICDRAILLSKGNLIIDGDVNQVCDVYKDM